MAGLGFPSAAVPIALTSLKEMCARRGNQVSCLDTVVGDEDVTDGSSAAAFTPSHLNLKFQPLISFDRVS